MTTLIVSLLTPWVVVFPPLLPVNLGTQAGANAKMAGSYWRLFTQWLVSPPAETPGGRPAAVAAERPAPPVADEPLAPATSRPPSPLTVWSPPSTSAPRAPRPAPTPPAATWFGAFEGT